MKRGFTLIELLVYMGLLGLFLAVVSNILFTVLETQAEARAVSAVDIDSRFILGRLAYDVARAGTIITPAAAGQTAATLVLDVATYGLVGGNLLLGSDQLNSSQSQVTAFAVTRIDNTVEVNFSLTSGKESRSYTTTLGLR